jgi:hypothetical protein
MRSDLIFDAMAHVSNRFLLTKLASKATRKFHRPNTRIQDTMNDVFVHFSRGKLNSNRAISPATDSPTVSPRKLKGRKEVKHAGAYAYPWRSSDNIQPVSTAGIF